MSEERTETTDVPIPSVVTEETQTQMREAAHTLDNVLAPSPLNDAEKEERDLSVLMPILAELRLEIAAKDKLITEQARLIDRLKADRLRILSQLGSLVTQISETSLHE